MFSDDTAGDVLQQMASNSNGSSQSLPQKLAKLEARMVGISPPDTFHSKVETRSIRQERTSPSMATNGGTILSMPTNFSDSDDEGADGFSIQPNPRKRKMFTDDGDHVMDAEELDDSRTPDPDLVSSADLQPDAPRDSGQRGRGRKRAGGAGTTGRTPTTARGKGQEGPAPGQLAQGSRQATAAAAANGHATAGAERAPQKGGPIENYFRKAQERQPGDRRPPPGAASVAEMACQTEECLAVAEQQWDKERRHIQERLDAQKERISHLESQVDELRRGALEGEQARARLEKELRDVRERDQQRLRVVSEMVVESAKWQRHEARARLRRDAVRYGTVSTERTGTMVREVWEEGQAFHDIQAKLTELLQQKEALEKKRKQVRKQHADRSETGQGEKSSATSEEEYLMKEEICKARLAALKREEEALMQDRQRYDAEKAGHIRELKRIRDEDASRFNKFQILHKRYALLNLIGRGGFSEVYKAFDLVDLCWVACKLHQLNSSWGEAKKREYVRHALREYDIHRTLLHPNIVRLRDIFEIDTNTFCTVLQYCEGKDLDAVLKATPVLSEREVRIIAVQVMSGLLHLNRPTHPRIIHYDLKPANILFDAGGEVKLTDFGLSKVMEEESGSLGMELTSQGAGTYWYLPPECFNVNEKPLISCKVDVWSLGVMVYQMLFGRRPFGHDQSQESILRNDTIVNARSVTFPPRPSVSNEAKEFIKRCLTYDQRRRPDVATIAQDPFLSYTKRKQ